MGKLRSLIGRRRRRYTRRDIPIVKSLKRPEAALPTRFVLWHHVLNGNARKGRLLLPWHRSIKLQSLFARPTGRSDFRMKNSATGSLSLPIIFLIYWEEMKVGPQKGMLDVVDILERIQRVGERARGMAAPKGTKRRRRSSFHWITESGDTAGQWTKA
jgi:hypothetical protein